ncbi:hypothetical protein PV703_03420 [Streptomyces sp. ME01-24h]|nr:hypothetical protein [Streptomyces sp. ME01-24h]
MGDRKFKEACVRCSLLRPDPAQRGRSEEIRGDLAARIAEAERKGRLGEVEELSSVSGCCRTDHGGREFEAADSVG